MTLGRCMAVVDDRDTLLRLLKICNRVFRWIVEESELIRDAELVRGFRNTLGDVSSALERTEGAVNVAIERGGNELTRLETRLAEVGLAGSQPSVKREGAGLDRHRHGGAFASRSEMDEQLLRQSDDSLSPTGARQGMQGAFGDCCCTPASSRSWGPEPDL